MDGEKKFVLVIVGLTAIFITVSYSFLFVALWEYRQLVGLSLLVVIILVVWVFLRGRLTEQDLRVARYRYHEEMPLDEKGEPLYWYKDYQPNPHRR